MKTPQQIKNSCNICFISYLGIIAIIFALLLSSCAGTYYVHDRPDTIYIKENNHNWWWWKINHSVYHHNNYIIHKPNKPNNRPNKGNKKRRHRK